MSTPARPAKRLTTTGYICTDHAIRYLASVPECRACPLKAQCCPNMPARRVVRDVNEAARDVARDLAKTEAFAQSRGPVSGLVGIEGGVVSGVINLESPSV